MEKNSRVVTGAWERIPEVDPGSRSRAGERKQSPEAEAEPRRESGNRSEDQKQAWNQMQSLEVEVEPGSESRSEPGSESRSEPGSESRSGARKQVRKRLPSVQWSVVASLLSAPYLHVCAINIQGQ